jgi:hypothetical protein
MAAVAAVVVAAVVVAMALPGASVAGVAVVAAVAVAAALAATVVVAAVAALRPLATEWLAGRPVLGCNLLQLTQRTLIPLPLCLIGQRMIVSMHHSTYVHAANAMQCSLTKQMITAVRSILLSLLRVSSHLPAYDLMPLVLSPTHMHDCFKQDP